MKESFSSLFHEYRTLHVIVFEVVRICLFVQQMLVATILDKNVGFILFCATKMYIFLRLKLKFFERFSYYFSSSKFAHFSNASISSSTSPKHSVILLPPSPKYLSFGTHSDLHSLNSLFTIKAHA